ncbi:hypothetical protein P8452_71207 [Trifolium repens]|nr:hypothetical protein P8452_71207 [Trifolium repens]
MPRTTSRSFKATATVIGGEQQHGFVGGHGGEYKGEQHGLVGGHGGEQHHGEEHKEGFVDKIEDKIRGGEGGEKKKKKEKKKHGEGHIHGHDSSSSSDSD